MNSHSKASSILRATLSTIALLCWANAYVHAQADFPPGTFFSEDFEDGDFRDNDPVNWERGVWRGGTTSIQDGSLIIAGTSGGAYFGPAHPNGNWMGYEDFSMVTQLRITDDPSESAFVWLTGRTPDFRSYAVRYGADGEVRTYESFQGGGSSDRKTSLQTEIDATKNDIMMRLDVFGDHVQGWVWEAGTPMPETPSGEFHDSTLTDGSVGFWVGADEPATFEIRDFQISATPLAVPEPSTSRLFAFAFLTLGITRRRRRMAAFRATTIFRNRS